MSSVNNQAELQNWKMKDWNCAILMAKFNSLKDVYNYLWIFFEGIGVNWIGIVKMCIVVILPIINGK